MRFTSDELARILLGNNDDSEVRRELFTQDGIERNKTVKNIHANLSFMMSRMKTNDALDLYALDASGKTAGERWIERHGVSDATRARYYSSLLSMANPQKHGGVLAALVDEAARSSLRAKMKEYDRKVKTRMDDNVADDRELRSILPWEDILAGYRANRSRLDDQHGLIADMYIGFADAPEAAPRRLDYNNLRVYAAAPSKKTQAANYVVARPGRGVVLHLSEFKTAAKRSEPIDAALPPGLSANILASLGEKPWRKYLLYRTRGDKACEPLSAHLLGYHVGETTQELTGRRIPVNGLRKSFITWLHSKNLSVAVLKRYAYNMGHSVETASLYRRLNIADSVGGGGDACFRCGRTGHRAADCK